MNNNLNEYADENINPNLTKDWRSMISVDNSIYFHLDDGDSKRFIFKNEGQLIEKEDFKKIKRLFVRFELVDKHGTMKYWDIRPDTGSGSTRLRMIDKIERPLHNKQVVITRVGKGVDTKYTILLDKEKLE